MTPADDRSATAAVLSFVAARWGAVSGDDVGMQVKRAAKAKGITLTRGAYLLVCARRFDMLARAFRLAARAADGEPIAALINERIDAP